MHRFLILLALASLVTCKTAPTTKQVADLMTEAEKTQNKIDRAFELADEIANARTPEAKAVNVNKYIDASKTALTSAEQTIENLRASLIQSETLRGDVQQKLDACLIDAGKYDWLKWFLIIGGPLVLVAAFLLGRKF